MWRTGGSPTKIRMFLSGDVMTGRGIDQILAHPVDPVLYETWAKSALRYVELAEQRNGPIPRRVQASYVWGDALPVLEAAGVDARIINLETAVTTNHEPWPGKGIHYRMHPINVDSIASAHVDCCVLANNHVLDWSYQGLTETLETLDRTGIATTGVGLDIEGAASPTIIETDSGNRVVVVAIGATSSGIPRSWGARAEVPGLFVAHSVSGALVELVADIVSSVRRSEDVVVVSIHWGPNWRYEIPPPHVRFAHRLIDEAGVHVVHGHSSHHPMGIEVYHGRLVLYGCGDLINDYEGIGGHEEFHPDLGIVYLATIDVASGRLDDLELVPMRMRRFRLEHAPTGEIGWIADTLSRESSRFGLALDRTDDRLRARW